MSTPDNEIAPAPEALDGRSRAARAMRAQQVPADGQPVPQGQRRRRASAGGFALKLDAEQRPGFVRRFVNGDPSRIQRMKDLGYEVVQDQAGEGSARTEGLGSTIARHAGKTEEGQPFKAYLMETPLQEFEYGVLDKEDARKPFEDAIRGSADTTGQVEGAYQPGQSTIRHTG